MLEVLSSQTYRHLFLAQAIALLGTGLATVALARIVHPLFQSRPKLHFLARIRVSPTRASIAWAPVEVVA